MLPAFIWLSYLYANKVLIFSFCRERLLFHAVWLMQFLLPLSLVWDLRKLPYQGKRQHIFKTYNFLKFISLLFCRASFLVTLPIHLQKFIPALYLAHEGHGYASVHVQHISGRLAQSSSYKNKASLCYIFQENVLALLCNVGII